MAAMMMATTRRAPRTYLLDANQDSDCAEPRNKVEEPEEGRLVAHPETMRPEAAVRRQARGLPARLPREANPEKG